MKKGEQKKPYLVEDKVLAVHCWIVQVIEGRQAQ